MHKTYAQVCIDGGWALVNPLLQVYFRHHPLLPLPLLSKETLNTVEKSVAVEDG